MSSAWNDLNTFHQLLGHLKSALSEISEILAQASFHLVKKMPATVSALSAATSMFHMLLLRPKCKLSPHKCNHFDRRSDSFFQMLAMLGCFLWISCFLRIRPMRPQERDYIFGLPHNHVTRDLHASARWKRRTTCPFLRRAPRHACHVHVSTCVVFTPTTHEDSMSLHVALGPCSRHERKVDNIISLELLSEFERSTALHNSLYHVSQRAALDR